MSQRECWLVGGQLKDKQRSRLLLVIRPKKEIAALLKPYPKRIG